MQSAALAETSRTAGPNPSRWSNRLKGLGDRFFTRLAAEPLPDPHWVATSPDCAAELGFPADWAERDDWNALQVLSGRSTWPGTDTLATVYSGHQFGVWAGQLGDGRALSLGELETPNGPRELQLKGSGRTPYSRGADGRAVLRSSIREFLASEAMHALGIPTTRALCITGSNLPVFRETVETAAVVTRVAPSFLRFGHFEHFSSVGDTEALQALADFVVDTYAPECRGARDPASGLLELVSWQTANLVAAWQSVGFCHGVMNTDNMSILGLTIDYGPFGFLDAFDPGHVCNHSDDAGRYAWGKQPQVAFWNLHALAHSMMALIGDEGAARAALETYRERFPRALAERFAAKMGLSEPEPGDAALIDDLLGLMAADRADFTLTFRRLAAFDSVAGADNAGVRDLFIDRGAFDAWALRYAERLRQQEETDAERALRMNRVNPKYVLRNHLAEVAIKTAVAGDFSEVERLRAVLQRPYDEQPDAAVYADVPPAWAQHIEVSCSS